MYLAWAATLLRKGWEDPKRGAAREGLGVKNDWLGERLTQALQRSGVAGQDARVSPRYPVADYSPVAL